MAHHTVDRSLRLCTLGSTLVPVASRVVGVVEHGSTLRIHGAAFGAKAAAAPWVWDDFENGIEGATLATSPTVNWTSYSDNGDEDPKYRGSGAYAGNLGAAKTGSYGADWTNYGVSGLDSDVMYLSWMFKWTLDSGNLTDGLIMKNTRINSTPSFYSGLPSVWVTMHAGGGVYSNFVSCNGVEGEEVNDLAQFDAGTWHRWEVYWKLSTPGQSDGFVRYFQDNQEVGAGHFASAATRTSACGNDQRADNFLLPMMWDRGDNAVLTFRADNVYVDRSLARVEIANSSTWAERSVSEIQIPQAWANDAIEVTVNLGHFTQGETVYLYIVDAQGNANTDGLAVIVGDTYD